MPDDTFQGVVRMDAMAPGPATPPGMEWFVGDQPLNRLIRLHEGSRVRVEITVLEDRPPESRPVRTIRDLTTPQERNWKGHL